MRLVPLISRVRGRPGVGRLGKRIFPAEAGEPIQALKPPFGNDPKRTVRHRTGVHPRLPHHAQQARRLHLRLRRRGRRGRGPPGHRGHQPDGRGHRHRPLPDLVDQVERNTGRRPKRFLADAGYGSDDNLRHIESKRIDAYVAVRRDKHSSTPAAAPRGRIPRDLSRRGRMARKLRTKSGRAHYARRKVIVEPVFGQVKEAMGFRRFSLRGKTKVTAEWHLVCASHDLAKLFRSGRAGLVIGGQDRPGTPRPSDGPDGDPGPACPGTGSSPNRQTSRFGPFSRLRGGDYERKLLVLQRQLRS
ncbi:MAG: transposase [Chloroflexota bacterium]